MYRTALLLSSRLLRATKLLLLPTLTLLMVLISSWSLDDRSLLLEETTTLIEVMPRVVVVVEAPTAIAMARVTRVATSQARTVAVEALPVAAAVLRRTMLRRWTNQNCSWYSNAPFQTEQLNCRTPLGDVSLA